jgi:adenine-specific DNA glycosylase
VWVSEVMLQQTRVPVVVGYYDRWMARWPTVRGLAAATQEVRNAWAQLARGTDAIEFCGKLTSGPEFVWGLMSFLHACRRR